MRYALIAISILTLFLGYQNYTQSKKITALYTAVSQIKEIITSTEPEMLATGTSFPDFSLKNAEDKLVTLDILPKTTNKVFVFSAAGCSYCEQYYPQLDSFAKQHQNIPVIIVQDGATVEENKKFLEEKQYSFEMLKGSDAIYDEFMISGTPTTIVLDADNKVIKAGFFSTAEEIEEVL